MIVESDNQILRELTRHTPEEIAAYEEEQRQQALREWQLRMAENKRILEEVADGSGPQSMARLE